MKVEDLLADALINLENLRTLPDAERMVLSLGQIQGEVKSLNKECLETAYEKIHEAFALLRMNNGNGMITEIKE